MKKLYRKGTVHPSPPSSSSPTSDQFISLSFLPAAILTLAAALSAEDKEVLAYLLSCSTSNPFDFDPSTNKSHKKHQNNKNLSFNNGNKTYNNNLSFNNNNNNNNLSFNNSSSSSSNNNNNHVTCFTCYCFSCYTSYWARWDSSPNRQLIHEIIDAFEDDLLAQKKNKQGVNNKRDKKKHNNNNNNNSNNKSSSLHNYAGLNVVQGCNNKGVKGSSERSSVRVTADLGRVGPVEEGGLLGQLVDEAGENINKGSVRKMVSLIGERIWGSVWG